MPNVIMIEQEHRLFIGRLYTLIHNLFAVADLTVWNSLPD